MALTPIQEAKVLALVAQEPQLLSLAASESSILSNLGATLSLLPELGAASSVSDSDLLHIRQGVIDSNVTAQVLGNYFASSLTGSISSDIQTQAVTAVTTSGTAPAFVAAAAPAIAALVAGVRLRVKFHAAGAGADALNVNGLGAADIKQYDSTGAKVAPVIVANMLADVEYDGLNWVILDQLPAAVATVPAASTTVAGVVELATVGEVAAGTSATLAVTPAGLEAKLATDTARGIMRFATNAEATAGTNTATAVTPAQLVAAAGGNRAWQNVTAQRVSGTVYTNTTGRDIFVLVSKTLGPTGSQLGLITVGGLTSTWIRSTSDPNFGLDTVSATASFIVPNGIQYSVTNFGSFFELR